MYRTSLSLPSAPPPYISRNTEPWAAQDLATLVRAYDRSVRAHGTVRWSDVTPLFPTRSKEACKAQVKTHKARRRAQEAPALGFAPPPSAAVLDLDVPASQKSASLALTSHLKATGLNALWVPRPPLEVVTNRPPAPLPLPSKPKLSARRVAEARRALKEVTRILEEDEEWHSVSSCVPSE